MDMAHVTVLNEEARGNEDELVRATLPLVQYAVAEVANRVPRHVSRDDLVSAAMAGLAQAARSFDPERGVTFARYASTRIKGALLDELRSRDWASRSVRAKARQVTGTSEHLSAKLGRSPSTVEVADAMGVAVSTVTSIQDDVHRAVILNFDALPVDGNADDVLLAGSGSLDEGLLDQERRAYLVAAVANLPERLRRVVIGYFFEDLPMQNLADELGVTDSRISQMRAEALGLLRDGINSQLDPELVELPVSSPQVARRRTAYFSAVASHDTPLSRLAPGSGRLASLVAVPA
jgi:RNA polymerase sigma factor for flagellar operon FliA